MQSDSEIAIIGYACRMPGARNSDAFWQLLKDNRCSVTWITPDRFPTRPYHHPLTGQKGRSYTFAAGVIDDVWGFDATAFGMSPREAEQVDPQQRHLLEVAYDALSHAGVRPSSLSGSDTGVYIGASSADYAARFFADPSVADVHMMTGNSLSIMANRLSYNLNLRGPSIAFDTACSSSLVALHLAADAIRSGAIDTAIVGGVNLLLSPFSYVGFSQASMLSPTGLCRPFDAAADGYVRSEGVVVLVLRSMAAAHKARNRIHGVVVGSGINQDGRTTGLSLPSPESQRALLDQVYSQFGIDPADLLFVEAHGTGTRVGDPIEADALGKGLGQKRTQPLPIGSVKSNVGHLEPVSGLAGLLKALHALRAGVLPATLHQQSPNSDIPFDELNLRVIGRNWRLPERRGPALAGVNSFGFGGTNAHAILRSDNTEGRVVYWHNASPPPPLLLTAHSAEALPRLAGAYDASWPDDARAAGALISASAHLRDQLPHRVLIRGGSAGEIRHHLRELAEDGKSDAALSGQAIGNNLPVGFLFSGNGSQWAGMGRDAWHANPRFRDALQEVDGQFAKVQKWSIVDMLFDDALESALRQASIAQPMLLALQVAIVRALEEAGIVPIATLGHSVGEIAAAWAAGALSLEQAIAVVSARSHRQEEVRHSGGMAAFMLSEREARRFLSTVPANSVEIAAVNSWRSVTVSGSSADIEKVLAAAAKMRVSARRLDVDYPFHSALIDSLRTPLLLDLDGLRPLPARRLLVSSVTGDVIEAAELGAEYWWRNVREPVRFDAGFNRLLEQGVRVLVEIGPKPILSSYVRDSLRDAGIRGVIVDTLTEPTGTERFDPIERAASKVLLSGGTVDLARFFGPPPAATMPLPRYPWQHTNFMVRPTLEASGALSDNAHPLLGRKPRQDCTEWFSTVDPRLFSWLDDHKFGAARLFPATAYIEIMLAAARETFGEEALELRDLDILRPLVFEGKTSYETLLRLTPDTGVVEFLSRARDGLPDWTLHARAVVGRSPISGRLVTAPSIPPGTVSVAKPKVYECARALGFDYGPAFQRARLVAFPHPKRAIAPLEKPAAETCGPFVIDFTALDAAFHALFASEEAGVADVPMRPMVPVRFGCLRSYAPGSVAMTATARTLKQSYTSLLVDIDLYDAEGKLVLSAEKVRLINAPSEAIADSASLSYRTTTWQLEPPARPSSLPLVVTPILEEPINDIDEGLLLLEAGCLRAAWNALSTGAAPAADASSAAPEEDNKASHPASFLRAALLWHLELAGLATEQESARRLAAHCDLPAIASIVTSLTTRHPTMVSEAASLARLEEILPDLVSGHGKPTALLASGHWRQLATAASQTTILRDLVATQLDETIKGCDSTHLLRLVMIGADHILAACDLVTRFANVELIVTDPESDRLEQARLMLGEDFPRIRCEPWTALAEGPAGFADLAFSIDGLSEIASASDGLSVVLGALRPAAPLLAAELAPSLFWDIARGARPTWWRRSANPEFPVGPLLSPQEWAEELGLAGFEEITASAVGGKPRLGVLIRARAGNRAPQAEPAPKQALVLSWEGDDAPAALRERIMELAQAARPPLAERAGNPTATDIVWVIDLSQHATASDEALAERLAALAVRCRQLTETAQRFWILMDFGAKDRASPPLEQPMWCAVTSAMRVAQNEYPGLPLRCLGVAGADDPAIAERIADELLTPDNETEIFLTPDQRLVFRIRRGATAPMVQRQTTETSLALGSRQAGGRTGLAWVSQPRPEPGPGEVEIKVSATGLNFRDVMWNLRLLPEEALEDGFAGPGLGMECAGTISRVGRDVVAVAPGDQVVAFAPAAFASHAIVPAYAISPLPAGFTPDAATTVPVAFLTAYYSLVHLGRLEAGQTVLIHGGAGAVGLAAIQIARQRGATVIATAGSEEKRAFLRAYGADLVCNSRTLSFAEEVAVYTEGRGVDVVLNSLAGEAMVRSIDCLQPFGRFIELGKRDFYANTYIGLRPLRRNLSYFGVDVDQLIGDHKELAFFLFGKIMQLFATGELVALPHRVFPGDHAEEAFRLMQRSGHIGKIVITPPAQQTRIAQTGRFPVDSAGLHVIVGGTGGFGMATAEWLVGRGARRLALLSRSGRIAEGDAGRLAALREKGVELVIEAIDVTDGHKLAQFIRGADRGARVKGIIHAAMVLDDRLIEGLDVASLKTVLAPKVTGALNLEKAIEGLELDYLLLYSSATTLFGNPGQYNYVAANGFLEGLARRLRSRGVPALAVAWGGIEDAGYLAQNISTDANLRRRFAANLISAKTALDGLDWTYDPDGGQATACCAIARIDWTMARRELVATRAPLHDEISVRSGARQSGDATAILEKLRALPANEVPDALVEIVVEEIARVLRLPPKEIDRHRPLAEIGMDSLMMLELRNTVEEVLQVELPMMSLSSGITPADVARRLAPLVTGEEQIAVPPTIVTLSGSHFAAEAEATTVDEREAAVTAVLERVRQLEGPL